MFENDPCNCSFCLYKRVDDENPTHWEVTVFCDKLKRDIVETFTPQDDDMVQLALLRADLSATPERQLHRVPGEDGLMYYEVPFEARAMVSSDTIEFSLWLGFRPVFSSCFLRI